MVVEKLFHEAKILIVDDTPANVLLLERLLKMEGYQHIYSVNDSREAVQTYEDIKPDVILLDLRMPYFDGFQILQMLKNRHEEEFLPVIIITAHGDQQLRNQALEQGAIDFIGKPFDRTEILMRIRNVIQLHMMNNQLLHQNEELEKRVDERTKEIQNIKLELIHRLGLAAEYRDNETGEHTARMSHYCKRLAKELGKDDAYCDLLFHASRLHDIGKIGIPDQILLKPGKLTPEEFQIMKTHTTIGEQLFSGLESFKIFQMAKRIALTHHEKWDGSGYPNQLKEKSIPLEGRIVAVCDVFDALTSSRPYKQAWSIEEAIKEIEKGKGKHFDPEIVDAFLRIIPEMIDIKKQQSSS
ncbi:HD domain-containing phosphohydrolase [Bacillus sp. REN10]|uniref:HD domain-containing phosphohydrolase n=1 Tax=Bacillus sp. REN10 TaxID=2782541 RepID=UPI00193BE3D2|nr:HD domain-containing phosphohydrolase [Bacillus sp. REN10]